jgi:hypothetical protein
VRRPWRYHRTVRYRYQCPDRRVSPVIPVGMFLADRR